MKKLLLLISLLVPTFAFAASPTATEVVDKVIENIRKAPSMSANISVSTTGNVSSGTILIAGERFVIDTDMGSSWFDGNTLWSYSPETNEVTIMEPTDSELAEINPFQFIKSARVDFTPRFQKTAPGSYTVELLPKKKSSNINKAVVTVDASTYNIKMISLTANKHVINIKLSAVKRGKTLPDSDFRFRKQLLPKAVINDLR